MKRSPKTALFGIAIIACCAADLSAQLVQPRIDQAIYTDGIARPSEVGIGSSGIGVGLGSQIGQPNSPITNMRHRVSNPQTQPIDDLYYRGPIDNWSPIPIAATGEAIPGLHFNFPQQNIPKGSTNPTNVKLHSGVPSGNPLQPNCGNAFLPQSPQPQIMNLLHDNNDQPIIGIRYNDARLRETRRIFENTGYLAIRADGTIAGDVDCWGNQAGKDIGHTAYKIGNDVKRARNKASGGGKKLGNSILGK